MTENECWAPVASYEDTYEVSSLGRVRRRARSTVDRAGRLRAWGERLLNPSVRRNGYRALMLSRSDVKVNAYVHHLVAHAFIGPRPPGMWINHIDGDKLNNRVENLEYVTVTENNRHAFRTGLQPTGESRAHTRLRDEEVRAIRRAVADGKGYGELAEAYGVTAEHVSLIARGKRRVAAGF